MPLDDDPETLAEVARLYYLEPRKKQKEIAAQYHVDSSLVSRRIEDAHRRGIVSIGIDSKYAAVRDPDETRSKRLCDDFELSGADVYEIRTKDDTPASDEDLHRILAYSAAKKLQEEITPGDHVVIGPGRTIHFLARAAQRLSIKRRNVRFTPLSGGIWTGVWQTDGELIERPLDADHNTYAFAEALETQPGTRFVQINHPLYAATAEEAAKVLERGCPAVRKGRWNWGLAEPKRGYVGIGVVTEDSSNRIMSLLQGHGSQNPAQRKYLSGARKEINKALAIIRTYGLPTMGDLAGLLFPVLPMPADLPQVIDRDLLKGYQELGAALRNLNDLTIAASWEHYWPIENLRALAGGPAKIPSMFSVLLAGRLRKPELKLVSRLSTDHASEKMLTDALRMALGSKRVESQYRQLATAARLFGIPDYS